MIFDEHSLIEYPKGLLVKQWTTRYDGSPAYEEEDDDDDEL